MNRFVIGLIASASVLCAYTPAHAYTPGYMSVDGGLSGGGLYGPIVSGLNPAKNARPIGSCASSQAFFARAKANIAAAPSQGATPIQISNWETGANGLICGQATPSLNTSGTNLFALIDVEYYTTAPTLALAEMNLKSASFTLVPGSTGSGGPTFVANAGLTGAATLTGFADTKYNTASGQMSQSSALMGVCILNNRTTLATPSFQSELGSQSTSPMGYVIDPLTGANTSQATLVTLGSSTTANFSTTTIPSTQGGFFVSRLTSTTFSSYFSGTLLSTSSITSSVPGGPATFYVFALNTTNGAPSLGNALTDTVGGIALGGGMTTAQVQALETLFTTALHAVGVSSGC
jgi:hypothetical protein